MSDALRTGKVLTDSCLWLDGVDHPEAAIESLRRCGLDILTTRQKLVDAAGGERDDLAWKLHGAGGGATESPSN